MLVKLFAIKILMCYACAPRYQIVPPPQGYGKDAADIARMAIEHGRKNGFDVVLIDTAGRMQDNEPLMRALAKVP